MDKQACSNFQHGPVWSNIEYLRRISSLIRRSFGPPLPDSDSERFAATEEDPQTDVERWLQDTDTTEPLEAEVEDLPDEADEIDHMIQQVTPFIVRNVHFDSLMTSLDKLLQRASSRSLLPLAELVENHSVISMSDSTQSQITYSIQWELFEYMEKEFDMGASLDLSSILTVTCAKYDEYQL